MHSDPLYNRGLCVADVSTRPVSTTEGPVDNDWYQEDNTDKIDMISFLKTLKTKRVPK